MDWVGFVVVGFVFGFMLGVGVTWLMKVMADLFMEKEEEKKKAEKEILRLIEA